MPLFNEPMRETLLKKTAAALGVLGRALAQHRAAKALTVEEQARLLGIDIDGLVRLSLCRVPRPKHFQHDVERVCKHVGANVEALLDVLRS